MIESINRKMLFQNLLCIFLTENDGVVSCQKRQQQVGRLVYCELYLMIADGFDAYQVLDNIQMGNVGKIINRPVERIIRIDNAVKTEGNVVGIQLSCRSEIAVAVETDSFLNIKNIYGIVVVYSFE